MRVTNHETDFERRIFAGYILTSVAVVLAAAKVLTFAMLSNGSSNANVDLPIDSYSVLERIAFVTNNSLYLGLVLLVAAFLFMSDGDDKPNAPTTSVITIAVLSICLLAISVISIAQTFLKESFAIKDDVVSAVTYLGPALLSFAAFAMTWPVVVSVLSSSNGDDGDNDDDPSERA